MAATPGSEGILAPGIYLLSHHPRNAMVNDFRTPVSRLDGNMWSTTKFIAYATELEGGADCLAVQRRASGNNKTGRETADGRALIASRSSPSGRLRSVPRYKLGMASRSQTIHLMHGSHHVSILIYHNPLFIRGWTAIGTIAAKSITIHVCISTQ